MARSQAATVEEYVEALPPARREVIAALRALIRASLPAGYEEAMAFGMIGYGVPLADYPNTYNRQPLSYVALAAQKNYFALYLTCVYGDPERERWLREQFRAAGKRLDMGKSCVRFRSLDDLPLEAIAELVASTPPARLIERYESVKGPPG
jgi:hypothetical protein